MKYFTDRAHRTTRNLVERGIGQLKRRFHVLHGEVRLSPQRTCQVVTCCAILHNICKELNIEIPEDDGDHDESDDENDGDHRDGNGHLLLGNNRAVPEEGHPYRQHLASQCFQ